MAKLKEGHRVRFQVGKNRNRIVLRCRKGKTRYFETVDAMLVSMSPETLLPDEPHDLARTKARFSHLADNIKGRVNPWLCSEWTMW